jgi:toxin FitB
MNVVDSCGWLEYIADGPNASFFEPALADLPNLIVPSITIYEVCKRVLVQSGQTFADRAVNAMSRGQVVHLDADNLRLAAIASVRYKLAMADRPTASGATFYAGHGFERCARCAVPPKSSRLS